MSINQYQTNNCAGYGRDKKAFYFKPLLFSFKDKRTSYRPHKDIETKKIKKGKNKKLFPYTQGKKKKCYIYRQISGILKAHYTNKLSFKLMAPFKRGNKPKNITGEKDNRAYNSKTSQRMC